MTNVKLKKNNVFIGIWNYVEPDLTPDAEGNRFLIRKLCFGPVETWEWGIDSDNKLYVDYKWLENDFFADESFHKEMSLEEMMGRLKAQAKIFADKGYPDCAEMYDNLSKELPEILKEKTEIK